jgi:hypothetical protein
MVLRAISSRFGSRPQMARRYPWLANFRAIANPIPLLPPVIKQTGWFAIVLSSITYLNQSRVANIRIKILSINKSANVTPELASPILISAI